MKFHLAHLAAVTDITPILAVRALWTWEGDFSSSDHEPASRSGYFPAHASFAP